MENYQENQGRSSDLVLAQGEYALIQDGTSGTVKVLVGPSKHSIAGTDNLVEYDVDDNRFSPCSKAAAVKSNVAAREGQYVIVTNPTTDGKAPSKGGNEAVELNQGSKVIVPGPATFALYPGQNAETIEGHQLRSNQYLVVRVYNEEEAKKNWQDAVVKTTGETGEKSGTALQKEASKLTTGAQLNIKGTEVSFYIPPTGIEVVPDEDGNLVREALTLQRLTYCILLSEDGEKRYVPGPDVVFPNPTEEFVLQSKSPKYKAIELNENMGLYIKVIADYTEDEKDYKAGDELFVTGNELRIYFPRPEHALIRYGQDMIHYACAIPKGEARYVLQKNTGAVDLVIGPKMYLPDPRSEVIVRRVLDPKTCGLWYPGNQDAIAANMKYLQDYGLADGIDADYRAFDMNESVLSKTLENSARDVYGSAMMHTERKASDSMSRNRNFTPPRTITLNTKYEGAVAINVWTGYAIQVNDKAGNRRVIEGPKTVLLEYDESLEIMGLSSGKPKNTDRLFKTAYLRVNNNKISDIISVETKDLVNVDLKVSYTVNFEGEKEKWYNVENYVKYLTDHMRSMVRNAVKKYGIEDFNAKAIDIVRDLVIGASEEGKDREGRLFKENGMRIVDLDVLHITIGDHQIEGLLYNAQHNVVKEALQLQAEQRNLATTKKVEAIRQDIATLKAGTARKQAEIVLEGIEQDKAAGAARLSIDLDKQEDLDKIAAAKLGRKEAASAQYLEAEETRIGIETKAYIEKFSAVTPELVANLGKLGDQELGKLVAQNLPKAEGSLGLLLGHNGLEGLKQMLAGTAAEKALASITAQPEEETE